MSRRQARSGLTAQQDSPPPTPGARAAKRPPMPALTGAGREVLAAYETALRAETDMRPSTLRNYLSDLRQFAAWCEAGWAVDDGEDGAFAPTAVTTPLLTRYRTYLQRTLRLRPASVNRALVSLKRYFAWASNAGVIQRNPATVVKLVTSEKPAPRQLTDREEDALVAAATAAGSPRDRTIIIMMLHTGLRASEVCGLRRVDVTLQSRSGVVAVIGKRNKYRDVPLNATARQTLREYLGTLPRDESPLFPSEKTGGGDLKGVVSHPGKLRLDYEEKFSTAEHFLQSPGDRHLTASRQGLRP